MSGPWDDKTPNTKYQMLWGGQWRPVISMYDMSNTPTTMPGRAAKVVLWVGNDPDDECFHVTGCGPADIYATPGHVTQDWEEVSH